MDQQRLLQAKFGDLQRRAPKVVAGLGAKLFSNDRN
jgi:hypothetical protein